MMLAAYNLIGLVSNNGNQNNNNDINNNNDNNNNNQNVNEATTDTVMMNSGMVILPPLPPGRLLNITAHRQTCQRCSEAFDKHPLAPFLHISWYYKQALKPIIYYLQVTKIVTTLACKHIH